ncbi:MAG: class II aldolase/adducin family protein [Chloroflexota bacterium]|nr:class II aldolase/adducin family protein [Chloroflexota bacterium]
MDWMQERQEVLHTAQALLQTGLVTGTAGNVSRRLGQYNGKIVLAITPTQRPYFSMRPEDIVVIDEEGEPVAGERAPSSESLLHLAIYRARPDAYAIVHTHSPFASVCAAAGLEIPPILDELVVSVGGTVGVAAYGFPGSQDLAERAVHALGDRCAVLLRHHGVVGIGRTLEQALQVCLLVERAAQVFLLAKMVGNAPLLPAAVVEAERAIYLMRQRPGEP